MRSKKEELLYVPLFLTESLLPFRGKETFFTRSYMHTDITIQGGADRTGHLPLPSGIIARRLLFHFITEAWIQNSPKVGICGTQTLLKKLNISIKDRSRRALKKQVYYLSMMTMRIQEYVGIDGEGFVNKNIPIMNGIEIYNWTAPEQLMLFRNSIEFSPQFFKLLQELKKNHPPIDKNVLWSITGPLQSDIYCWLQRRLQHPDTANGKSLSWDNLYDQFGRGQRVADFVYRFKSALKSVLPLIKYETYGSQRREFPVEITREGIVLYNIDKQVESEPKVETRSYF